MEEESTRAAIQAPGSQNSTGVGVFCGAIIGEKASRFFLLQSTDGFQNYNKAFHLNQDCLIQQNCWHKSECPYWACAAWEWGLVSGPIDGSVFYPLPGLAHPQGTLPHSALTLMKPCTGRTWSVCTWLTQAALWCGWVSTICRISPAPLVLS